MQGNSLAVTHVDDMLYAADTALENEGLKTIRRLVRVGSEDILPPGRQGKLEFTSVLWERHADRSGTASQARSKYAWDMPEQSDEWTPEL